MPDSTPKAWLCKHCNERVDPTMELCWSCGHDRQGQQQADFASDEAEPFKRCPQCDYDLRGNLEAEVCPECGFELAMSGVQKQLYWVPSTTKLSAVVKLFRNPLRMIPIAMMAWLLVGLLYLADEEVLFFKASHSATEPGTYFVLLAVSVALLFTFFVIGGIMVQGLEPPDDEQTEPSVSTGDGFILSWLTRGWGRYLFWMALGLLLLSILLFSTL